MKVGIKKTRATGLPVVKTTSSCERLCLHGSGLWCDGQRDRQRRLCATETYSTEGVEKWCLCRVSKYK